MMNAIICYIIGLISIFGGASVSATTAADSGSRLPSAGNANASAMTDIHDIKPILAMDSHLTWLFWLAGALLCLGLLFLAWCLYKKRRKPDSAGALGTALSPEQEAYQALDRLAAESGLPAKQFYFRLSSVVRRYVERRFEFPAAEMTTEELLPRVDRLPLNQELARNLKQFCRYADPIKFAGAPAQKQRMTHDLVFARDLVRQTTTEMASPTEADPSGPQDGQAAAITEPLEPKKRIALDR